MRPLAKVGVHLTESFPDSKQKLTMQVTQITPALGLPQGTSNERSVSLPAPRQLTPQTTQPR